MALSHMLSINQILCPSCKALPLNLPLKLLYLWCPFLLQSLHLRYCFAWISFLFQYWLRLVFFLLSFRDTICKGKGLFHLFHLFAWSTYCIYIQDIFFRKWPFSGEDDRGKTSPRALVFTRCDIQSEGL